MILVIKNEKKNELDKLIKWIKNQGFDVHMSEGASTTIVGLVGDTSKIDVDLIASLGIVESVKRISEPYKKANRKFHPNDTVVKIGGAISGYEKNNETNAKTAAENAINEYEKTAETNAKTADGGDAICLRERGKSGGAISGYEKNNETNAKTASENEIFEYEKTVGASAKITDGGYAISLREREKTAETNAKNAEKTVAIGGGSFTFIAGPCSVESRDQIVAIALAVKKSGASILRGGAFKPRTSPYAFQGLGAEGIRLLLEAKKESGLPIVTEIMNAGQLPLFQDVDIIQIGARNMQNFDLLKEVGQSKKPILLKRGLANTIEEWLMSAEYIMSQGNENVVLCERGIRTVEQLTRNTLDLSAIPLIKELTHLPVIVDPSHATGLSRLVLPLSMAAAAAGSDGLMIEVHNDPPNALCDGAQSIRPEEFDEVSKKVGAILAVVGKARNV
jgi:3-deoxy-7-phosphoheptulonate synthase